MVKSPTDNHAPATRLVTGGRRPEWTGPAVNPPVWRASTHLYENTAALEAGHPNDDGYFHYGRRGAPTQWALAEALTELETGAAGTMLYPSGVAAIADAVKVPDCGFKMLGEVHDAAIAAKACSRSAMRSDGSSRPMERRMPKRSAGSIPRGGHGMTVRNGSGSTGVTRLS